MGATTGLSLRSPLPASHFVDMTFPVGLKQSLILYVAFSYHVLLRDFLFGRGIVGLEPHRYP